MSPRKASKAEARRAAAGFAQKVLQDPLPLPRQYALYLTNFQPQAPLVDTLAGRAAIAAIMSRAGYLAWDNFRKHCSDVAALVSWAQAAGHDTDWQALMAHSAIHEFSCVPVEGMSENHRAHRMRRLKTLATRVNPGASAPPKPAPVSHRAVQNPYTNEEMSAIVRVVRNQPSGVIRRQLCAVVGVCRGAGAGSFELRPLTRSHFTDLGDDGILVRLGAGASERVVPVRYEWESLVRDGLEGLRGKALVLGTKQDRRNIAARVVDSAVILGTDAPRIDAARLRSTWLADLMTDAIPIQVIMHAAGLKTARSITDIAEWLEAQGAPLPVAGLRGDCA